MKSYFGFFIYMISTIHGFRFEFKPHNDVYTTHLIKTEKCDQVEVQNIQNVLYAGQVLIGEPQTPFTVQFDTGSDQLWIMAGTGDSKKYDHTKSDAYEKDDSPFAIAYGDGSQAKGYFSRDNVTIGDLTIPGFRFGECWESEGNIGPPGIQGILGLSRKMSDYDPLPIAMHKMGLVPDPIFGLWLGSKDLGGELTLGSVDSTKYHGDIYYMENEDSKFWAPKLETISFEDKSFSFNTKCILDSGSTRILLPENVFNAYVSKHSNILKKLPNSDDFYMNCENQDQLSDMWFTMGGTGFRIKGHNLVIPNDCVCLLAMQASADYIILGDSFLRSYYSVYNLESGQIGLARSIENDDVAGLMVVKHLPKDSGTNPVRFDSILFSTVLLLILYFM